MSQWERLHSRSGVLGVQVEFGRVLKLAEGQGRSEIETCDEQDGQGGRTGRAGSGRSCLEDPLGRALANYWEKGNSCYRKE